MSEARDLDGLDLPAVDGYLRAQGLRSSDDAPLTAELISGGRSNLTYRLTDGHSKWVLRRPPLGEVLQSAHDMSREYRVMRALEPTPVPVPKVVAVQDDGSVLGAPFYVMDAVDGVVYRKPADLAALDLSTRALLGENLVDTLAALHDIDPSSIGLQDFGRPDGYLERQVSRWLRQFARIKMRELEDVVPVGETLMAHLPRQAGASIVHGDYRLDNVMVQPGGYRIAAVLDWEMATLGDPLADLGTLIMFWDAPGSAFNPITDGLMAVDGFMSPEAAAVRYAEQRGISLEGFDWYLAFARFKLAIILEQIHVRHLRGQTRGHGFDGLDEMVTSLLANARATLQNLPRA